MDIRFRMAKPEDDATLIHFWRENGGWDELDQAAWDHRFNKAPMGKARIVIAQHPETEELVGQLAFFPIKVTVNDMEGLGYRGFAVIIKKEREHFKGILGMKNITVGMNLYAADIFKEEGATLIYHLPDPRWARWFNLLSHMRGASFPLYTFPIDEISKLEIKENYSSDTIPPSSDAIDNVWNNNQQMVKNSIVRDKKVLPWKISHGPFLYLGITKNEQLMGWATFIKREHSRQFLIGDIIAMDTTSLKHLLIAVCKAVCKELENDPEAKTKIDKVSILGASWMLETLEGLGFKKNKYRFPFFIQQLDEKIDKKTIGPKNWFVCAND